MDWIKRLLTAPAIGGRNGHRKTTEDVVRA